MAGAPASIVAYAPTGPPWPPATARCGSGTARTGQQQHQLTGHTGPVSAAITGAGIGLAGYEGMVLRPWVVLRSGDTRPA